MATGVIPPKAATNLEKLDQSYANFSATMLSVRVKVTEGQLSIEAARPRPQ